MGRTLKRVPPDFAHPINTRWPGYVPPDGLTDDELDAWQPADPPTGDGYQLWETTSEGSPISPVFESLDELCAWAEMHETVFADVTATAAEWRAMLERDRVQTRVQMPNGSWAVFY